ncbi:MAG TPA: hypothetical protein VNY73_06685, partial [Bacteroidia bacterium]|nr:hypothetical protein [Bacteroidia bacterium]
MKKIYLLIITLLLIENINAQTSWKGTTSTNWSTASNWTAGVPVATVDAIIGDANFTGVFQPNLTASATCKSLTIGTGSKASTLTAAKNITVSGNITIGSNGTVIHNTANVVITLKGNWSNSGTYTSTVSTAMVTFSGAAQSLAGATTFQRVTINTGSTLTLANNIIVNNAIAVSGTFDPTAAFTVSGTGTLTVNAGGSILVQAADFTTNYPLLGTINLSGTSTVKYASATINQNITNVLTYGYLRISGGMTKSLTGNLPAINSSSPTSGRIYVDAGTLDLVNYTANRGTTFSGGSVIVAAGASLKIGGTNSFPSNFTTISLAATSTVEYSGTNQTVLAASYGNLTLSSGSGAAVKTMPAAAMTIAGSLTGSVGSGTSVSFTAGNKITVNVNVNLDAATTFNAGSYSHTFKGNFTNNGVFTGSTSSVTLSGVSAVVSGTGSNNFYNLTFKGVGITAPGATSLGITGNLVTSGSGTFIHSPGGTLTMSGVSKTISGNGLTLSNCIITGTVTTTSNIILSGNLTVNGSLSATGGTITMNGSSVAIAGSGTISFYALSILGTVTTANNLTLLSNLSVSLTGSLTATAGATTMNGSIVLSGTANLYDVVINSGKTLRLGTNSLLSIANNFTKTGTLNVTTTVPNTVQYNSAGAQTIVSTTYHNLILSNGSTKTATGAITVNNDLTINSGTTFNASSFTHSIYQNFTNNGAFTANTSTIQLLGANPAIISGVTTFNNLTVNKNSLLIIVTLASSIYVTNLTGTNGTMQTGSNSVTITGTRTGAGIIIGTITHSHAFVSGTAYYFEGPQNAITFTSPSASLTSVTVIVSIGIVTNYIGGQECVNREYNISIPSGTYSNATLRLHYEDNELNAFYEPSLVQYRYNTATTNWDSIGCTTRNTTSNYVEKTGIVDVTSLWVLSGIRNVVLWNGSVSSAWENAANWTTLSGSSMANRVPTSTDDAQIGQGTFTYNPIINSNQTVNILR